MFDIDSLFVVTGVILVLFFAVLLLTAKKYKSLPHKFLAASLIVLSILILRIHGFLEDTILEILFDFFRIEYLFAVFLYMYVYKTLKKSINRISYVILLTPFIFFSGIYTFALLADEMLINAFTLIEYIEPFEIYLILLFNSVVVLYFTLKVYQSNQKPTFKKWIYSIAIGLLAIMMSFLILEFIEMIFDMYYLKYVGILITLSFCYITYFGVQQLQIEQELSIIRKINTSAKSSTITTKKHTGSHFSKIMILMNEALIFKNPDLDRELLASQLSLSVSSITRIIKEETQMHFKDFINKHRIELAKDMLIDTRFDIFSLEAIGKEVGFASRSTFYDAFKKETGISPGVFKKQRQLSDILPNT